MADRTDSPSTFNQIQRWIDQCLENHRSCQIPGPSSSERPTRLIRIDQSASTFQLTTQVAAETRYAAVSYRWGTANDVYKLTTRTIEGMQKGVSTRILPKTIQDTLTIARGLDLEFIWIDRLCILQDCQKDWSREASRMAFIYKHAYVTISASCASHENQGCFRKRNSAGIQPLLLNANPLLPRVWSPPSHESSQIASEEPKIYQKEGGKLGHLADRGWILQERVLSQRVIHFAEDEVHWECKELQASEAWPESSEYFSARELRPAIVSNPLQKYRNEQQLWYHLVHDYSARECTYEKDKLPALSGLSREKAAQCKGTRDEYLAGLWRSTILVDLCWRTEDDTPRIPERYLAPSWSWASLHAKVLYALGTILVSDDGFRPFAEFKDARLKFATEEDSHGAVHDGWIHLFGRLKPVTVVRQTFQGHEHRRAFWSERICDVDGKSLSFLYSIGRLDIESFAAGGSRAVPIFCLPIIQDQKEKYGTTTYSDIFCLLLVENGSIKHKSSGQPLKSPETQYPDEYQRAGMVRIMIKDWDALKAWIEESPERDIVIR